MDKKSGQNTVIINATNIGHQFQGLGVYSLNLLKEFAKIKTSLQFIVYVNESAQKQIAEIAFPENFSIRWVSKLISPDNKFTGHFLRLLYSNWIAIKHRNVLQFNTSQLEINFFKKNQIVTIHDVIPLLFKHLHKKQYHYYKYLIGFGLKKANYILTPSNHSKELLQNIFNIKSEQIKVIHNGSDNYEKQTKIPQLIKDNYIMYVGRICEMKNISVLLKAFEIISKSFTHKLLVVGDDEKQFNKKISDARLSENITSRIIFKQNVCEEEKTNLLSKASLFVFPSLYEGFGLPPIEAMACGCPVVVSKNSSLPEICGDAAIYTDPKNISEIASAINKVLSDKSLMTEMVFKSLNRAKMFKWEYSAIDHMNIFERVLRFQKLPNTNIVPEFRTISSIQSRKIVSTSM